MVEQRKTYGGRWRVIRDLGRGGQGRVYEVEDAPGAALVRETLEHRLKNTLRSATAAVYHEGSQEAIRDLIDLFREISNSEALAAKAPHGALKELLPFEDAVNAGTARERLSRELTAMASLKHPHIIALLDSNADEKWLVTQYCSEGSLARHPKRYEGQVLEALKAIRGLVDGVAFLHRRGIVHRDIKPSNIFISDAGQLLLGDFGLVFESDHVDRVTETFENVGTRDFMPPWAMGVRIENIEPSFDVFSLMKVLWTMISGRPRMPLWYWDDKRFDLAKQFPDDAHVRRVNQLFANTLVQFEFECLPSASELLAEIDKVIQVVEASAQLPSTVRPMRCRFCGLGVYQRLDQIQADGFSDPSDRRYIWHCQKCGHLQSFFWPRGKEPAAWANP